MPKQKKNKNIKRAMRERKCELLPDMLFENHSKNENVKMKVETLSFFDNLVG